MLLRKGVKNANLVALRDPQFCHFKLAPLRRTWVAPLGRSLTFTNIHRRRSAGKKKLLIISYLVNILNLTTKKYLSAGK